MANSERIYLIQGNDTDMSVCLRKGGDTPLPYDLTGASRIGLALTGHGLSFFARDIEVSGEDNNIISGLLAGDLLVGEYGLEVSFTLDGKAKRFRVPQVFEVVTYLSEDQDGTAEGEGDGISITVTVQPDVIEIAGPTGPQGHDGKSAYEVWLDEGHTGDEDDFFRWLAAQTPNPDWAQNDASEPDYVENRTHYDIPAVSLPDTFITFRWTEDDYSDLMFYLNDETPMPRMSENTWGVQLGQWLLSCYINGNVLEVDLDGDPILTVANFRPGRTPQPILVGDIEVPELVQQLDGKYLGLKTVNGQSVKGSGDIALNGGNLEYTGDDGEYISGGDSINSSLLLLDEAVDETNGRLDNLKGSQVVYDGEDGDSVIVHGETVDQCLKGLDDQAAYIIENYQYKIPDIDTIRAGAALGATAYQKPSTGIPKSALASAVKTSLEKADTALQPSDLNGYATEDYVDEEVSGKQEKLVSGENIKTINGQSVLGSGDIQTGGGSADAVKYTSQSLTDAQKTQARANIAAASESEVSQLRSEVEGATHSFSIQSATITGYAKVELQSQLTAGMVITGFIPTPSDAIVWLGVNNVQLKLNDQTFPLTLAANYSSVFGNKNGSVVINGNDGSGLPDSNGLINDLAEIENNVSELDLLADGNQQSYRHYFEQSSGYEDYGESPSPLPTGTRINKFDTTTDGVLWLCNANGTSTLKLTDQTLPYVTNEVYYGLRYNKLNRYASITYSQDPPIDGLRKNVRIFNFDSQLTIFQKFYNAFIAGNTDIYFDKGVYTLDSVYDTIRETIGDLTAGLPIGNGCRYYFNGATIISNPSPTDNWSDSRMVLDNQRSSQDYELHDGILINNGGRYCVHDEGAAFVRPYTHKYINMQMYYNTTQYSPVDGPKAFGAGAGYDTTLIFDGCIFANSSSLVTCLSIHGINEANPAPCILRFSMRDCYVKHKAPYYNLFDKTRDTVEFFLANNCFGTAFDGSETTQLIEFGTIIES